MSFWICAFLNISLAVCESVKQVQVMSHLLTACKSTKLMFAVESYIITRRKTIVDSQISTFSLPVQIIQNEKKRCFAIQKR
jgi:hypothetical protein